MNARDSAKGSESATGSEQSATGNSEFTIQNSQFRILSRRQWLLKLGEAAVLLGFSGTVDESDAVAARRAALAASDAVELPPGLYLPSSDHLGHALAGDSLFHAVPSGTETDYRRPPSGPYQPQFFSSAEFQTVRRMLELMLGESEGSSVAAAQGDDHENVVSVAAEWLDLTVASAAGVREASQRLSPSHRALAVAFHSSEERVESLEKFEPEPTCREGLSWLEEESRRRRGKPFVDLTEEQQLALLTEISDVRPDARPGAGTNKSADNPGVRLFGLIKREMIRAYYTSRTGLRELDYKGNAFYAESPGCGHDQGGP